MAKIIPYIFCVLLFFAPRHAPGQVLVLRVDDLLMETPHFTNAPDFSIWNGMNGGMPVGDSARQPRKTRAEREAELLDLAWSIFPSADSIVIWNGKLIVKLKN